MSDLGRGLDILFAVFTTYVLDDHDPWSYPMPNILLYAEPIWDLSMTH